jgi:hypothetical protein
MGIAGQDIIAIIAIINILGGYRMIFMRRN